MLHALTLDDDGVVKVISHVGALEKICQTFSEAKVRGRLVRRGLSWGFFVLWRGRSMRACLWACVDGSTLAPVVITVVGLGVYFHSLQTSPSCAGASW
jgi:hypothetical protein